MEALWNWEFSQFKVNGDLRDTRRTWQSCRVIVALWNLLNGLPSRPAKFLALRCRQEVYREVLGASPTAFQASLAASQ